MSDAYFQPILLALPSLTPSLAVELLPHGLTVHRLFVQADGRTHDLVVGPEDPRGHLEQKYTNTIIGRYTNRVPVGSYSVSRNGLTSQVSPQPNSDATPTVSLHGGPTGFDAADFEPIPLDALVGAAPFNPENITASSPPGALFTPAELNTFQSMLPQGSSALFRMVSKDGDQGYPGTLLVEVVVGLLPPNAPRNSAGEYHLGSIVFIYRAKLVDGGKKVVTPINLTQHWGFNLDASLKEGPESESVKGHSLTIKATHIVDVDPAGLSTGELIAVADTPHKHEKKLIGDQFPEVAVAGSKGGYDHFYVFAPRKQTTAPAHRIPVSSFKPDFDYAKEILSEKPDDSVVELASKKSGLRLSFETNQSGVQFYSNNFATGDGAKKRIHGGSGKAGPGQGYGAGSAAFLEFHEPIASFLHPSTNPSGNDTLLGPDEIYNNFVRIDVLYNSPHGL
ncbi:hypothetical protein EW146_g2994 [Bondarzewia mesenterica]|uniref:Galactose mutarotase-like protein n=1 Tax=Bondarzewia mesenterica TaxID=1095465 RepID=A0A4S4M0F7_9AGAM|nr:hypothetical protein EW146_g2994 [Bondarzewia mesenterica]